ncbi:MAG: PilZ domain-containing protein [Candidatus Eremiobacteraeota bacterium]|nr:PilZ domain-containing protein [Candidatus Eremiobacteraeota bacterium]
MRKLTAPGLQVTGYGQGVIHFKCAKALKTNTDIDCQASLPGGVRCELTVNVQGTQDGEYVAKVAGPPQSLTLLEKIFLPGSGASKEQMFYKPNQDDMTRHARTYAVRSREFPDFKGATAELSRAGALVMLTGEVQAGKDVHLEIELDEVATVPVDATVEWCTQRDKKTWIASLNFKPLTPQADAALGQFLETLKHRAPGHPSTLS